MADPTLERLTLELTTEGYQYEITNLIEAGASQEKPQLSISVPGTSPSGNILIGIQGMQGELPIRFRAHNNGEDKALGTAPTGEFDDDTVVTISEQARYLEQFIHSPDINAEWTLDHQTGDRFNNDVVTLERMNTPTLVQDSPKWHEWDIRVRRGGNP